MIIGINGVKQAGKDTSADFFVEQQGFTRIGYADTLKEAVANLFDVPVSWTEKYKSDTRARVSMTRHYDTPGVPNATEYASDMSLRAFLQRFGTEMGRNTFGEDFWVQQLKRRLSSDTNYVIPDVRFANEVVPCDFVIEIVRPGFSDRRDAHVSEQPLDEDLIDYIVVNSGEIGDLHKALGGVYEDMLKNRALKTAKALRTT